jgi:probable addiction module antidote protein
MPKKTRSYRSWQLERLANPKIAADYLNASLKDSSEIFLRALGNVAQARQMAKVARDAGVQRETLYRSLSEQGNPTLDTLSSILKAVGLKIFIGVEGVDGPTPSAPSPEASYADREGTRGGLILSPSGHTNASYMHVASYRSSYTPLSEAGTMHQNTGTMGLSCDFGMACITTATPSQEIRELIDYSTRDGFYGDGSSIQDLQNIGLAT